jgi:hypothetical protein
MMITPVFQPKGSNMCGQACVAMAAGVSLSTVATIMGKGPTTGKDLHHALKRFKIDSSEKVVRIGPNSRIWKSTQSRYFDLPARCIAKCRSGNCTFSHWILIWDGKTYDPYPGTVPWQYISGYIEIETREETKNE